MIRALRVMGLVLLASACSGGAGGTGDSAAGAMAAAAPAAADPAAARAAIDSANQQSLAAFNSGSLDGMLGNYAEDAIMMMPGTPAMNGKAAITAGMRGMLESMEIKNFKPTTTDVTLSGDLAVETGTLTLDAGPKGGKLTADTIKYLTVWKKQADGSWKIIRDINNTDIAPKM